MASSSFDQLGLIPPLAQAVRELGYEQPTPVQEQAIPLVLAGGRSVQLKGGRHIKYPKETPLANLHLTLLDKLGVHLERTGDSTGRLDDRVLAGV